jgi:hypothetical protein
MKKILYIFGVIWLLAGCATLTKTQIENVNQFAETTKNFSEYPSKIMEGMADIRFKRGVYYANSLSDPKIHIGELNNVYAQKKFDNKVAEKVDVTFKIIDKYAQSLALLSSDKYEKDLAEKAKAFGVNIDTLISLNNSIDGTTKVPVGIGDAVGQLIVMGGKQFTRVRQAKEIKKFVAMADTLIEAMTNNILDYLESKNINELILNEEKEITRNYLSYLQQTPRATIQDELGYMELKAEVDEVRELQEQSIKATKKLRKAHAKLLENIREKKKLKNIIVELQDLYEDISSLKTTVEKLEINDDKE